MASAHGVDAVISVAHQCLQICILGSQRGNSMPWAHFQNSLNDQNWPSEKRITGITTQKIAIKKIKKIKKKLNPNWIPQPDKPLKILRVLENPTEVRPMLHKVSLRSCCTGAMRLFTWLPEQAFATSTPQSTDLHTSFQGKHYTFSTWSLRKWCICHLAHNSPLPTLLQWLC